MLTGPPTRKHWQMLAWELTEGDWQVLACEPTMGHWQVSATPAMEQTQQASCGLPTIELGQQADMVRRRRPGSYNAAGNVVFLGEAPCR